MANAWIIKPLVPVGAVASYGTVQVGVPANVFNDYAGVTLQIACDAGGSPNGLAGLSFDLGADVAVDTIMLFGVDLTPAQTTVNASYATAAQGNFTGASTGVPAVPIFAGSQMPVSGRGITLLSLATPAVARYWRINILASGAGQGVRIARLVIGKRIQLGRNFAYGASFGVRDLGSLDFSRRGVLLRARGAKLRTVQLTFSNIQKDEVEATTKPLLETIGNTDMVAVVTDPSADPQLQNRCDFGPLVGDLAHAWRNARAWEAKISVVGIF